MTLKLNDRIVSYEINEDEVDFHFSSGTKITLFIDDLPAGKAPDYYKGKRLSKLIDWRFQGAKTL